MYVFYVCVFGPCIVDRSSPRGCVCMCVDLMLIMPLRKRKNSKALNCCVQYLEVRDIDDWKVTLNCTNIHIHIYCACILYVQ